MSPLARLHSRDSIGHSAETLGRSPAGLRLIETRTFGLIGSLLLPAAVTFGALRFLIPSRIDAGATGLFALLARAEDAHPLLLAITLFLLLSEVAKYWLRRVRGRFRTRAPAALRAVAQVTPPKRGALPVQGNLRFAAWLAALATISFVARAKVAEIYRVVSPSMVPTLSVGDRLFVNKLAYGLRLPFSKHVLRARPPRRGDLIVFPNQGRDGRGAGPASLVKRVIGLPGDEIAFANGSPIVNGWVVPSCDAGPFLSAAGTSIIRGRLAVEILEDRAYLTLRTPLDETRFARFKVPPGELFVLGDSRGVSIDSRSWNGGRGGGVRIDSVEGRVSRLAIARLQDGHLDLRHPFAGLRPNLRETNVDVGQLEHRIAACLAHPPRSSWPPAVPLDPVAPAVAAKVQSPR
jgi:signal peptidase I